MGAGGKMGGGGMGGMLGGMGGGMGGGGGGGGVGGLVGGMGMDLSPYKLPVVGNFFQDPNAVYKQQQMNASARAYDAYRPEVAQARQNALQQQLGAYQPMNSAMGQMYGGGAQQNFRAMSQNPMSERMMQIGRQMPQQAPKQGNWLDEMQNWGSFGGMGGPGGLGPIGSFVQNSGITGGSSPSSQQQVPAGSFGGLGGMGSGQNGYGQPSYQGGMAQGGGLGGFSQALGGNQNAQRMGGITQAMGGGGGGMGGAEQYARNGWGGGLSANDRMQMMQQMGAYGLQQRAANPFQMAGGPQYASQQGGYGGYGGGMQGPQMQSPQASNPGGGLSGQLAGMFGSGQATAQPRQATYAPQFGSKMGGSAPQKPLLGPVTGGGLPQLQQMQMQMQQQQQPRPTQTLSNAGGMAGLLSLQNMAAMTRNMQGR